MIALGVFAFTAPVSSASFHVHVIKGLVLSERKFAPDPHALSIPILTIGNVTEYNYLGEMHYGCHNISRAVPEMSTPSSLSSASFTWKIVIARVKYIS